jgi:hypothetical protein
MAAIADRGRDLDRVELGSADLHHVRVDKYLHRRLPAVRSR